MRVTDRNAHRFLRKLVDVSAADAAAGVLGAGAEVVQGIGLVSGVERQRAPTVGERVDGLEGQGAGEALTDEAGVGSFENGDAVDQLRGILVELDAAVVARADLFATVEQRVGEVRREPADGDDLRAAGDALGREAGEPGDGLGDGDVGQLADVLGRDDFGHAGQRLLHFGRGGQTRGEPGGYPERAQLHDLAGGGRRDVGFFGCGRRTGRGLGAQERVRPKGEQTDGQGRWAPGAGAERGEGWQEGG